LKRHRKDVHNVVPKHKVERTSVDEEPIAV